MSGWKQISDKQKYGVVICNYQGEEPLKLKLIIGDSVYIIEECEEWYYGYSTRHRSCKGIFPKNYIYTKEAVVDGTGFQEFVFPKEQPIIQEITSTLREWGGIWKQLYIRRNENFDKIRKMMYELIDYRRHILSGTLPMDELKELKQKVTSLIDVGNKLLELDLVVRDDQGNILNPDTSSTINLYCQHELATQRLLRVDTYQVSKSITRYSHCLYVSLKNFVCKIGDDADLLMTLYDAKEGKFISENYVVKWAKEGLARDLDQLNNLRVLFTDLGSKDLSREKVFLVCQIIRIGAMDLRDYDHRRLSHMPKKNCEVLRRPFGVAAMDVTDFIVGKLESDEEKQHFIPFFQCGERDFLDTVIKKVISSKETGKKEHKGQGLWVSLKMLHGDLKQVREDYPHIVSTTISIARKMGFPEIILPGDVRNDLYLTLVQGEFSKGTKSSDKNVEVIVRVCNEQGRALSDYISIGAGAEQLDEFRSVIYYHEDKPKWCETFKVAIPIEEFSTAHLKFMFRHRSSNEAKDKAEKPFAMSFVKLHQKNGTTLKDECHDLLVYKVDHKKYDDGDVGYLSLPSTRSELEHHRTTTDGTTKVVFQSGGLSLTGKDNFQISTLICSTKLTQNVDLLGLLKWSDNQENLKSNLLSLMKVDGEEVVKFLQDVLDALFNILMLNTDSDLYDNLMFEALVFIIGLISDRKYQHFRPVLDLYIKETFSATLAYSKLIVVFKCLVDNASEKDGQDSLLRVMKSLEYIFKFIIRSRILFSQLNEGKGKQQFELSLKQLFDSFSCLMLFSVDSLLLVQGACLKYIPTTIADILLVYDAKELSYFITDLINNVPMDRLTKQKMMCVNDVVHSNLFKIPECRDILLPVFNAHVRVLLKKREEIKLCVKIISDILEVLYRKDVGCTHKDINDIMLTVLRTVIQTVIEMDRSSPLVGNLVAIMIAILRQMTDIHYREYISRFPHRSDLLDFLMEILLVFRDLVNKTVYPKDWIQMIMLQNSVLLKALRYFSQTIRERFASHFEYQVWNNFFHCAISFLTQDFLQLENFSENKRNKIISRYKDMRREMGFEIRALWFSLGQNKISFVPGMVGPFLEMTLIPEIELRKATIPIFFDMMKCEFLSPFPHINHEYNHDEKELPPSGHHYEKCKGNFAEFENEMITQLDVLIEGGRGDEQYKELFSDCLTQLCENQSVPMREQGLKFVGIVTKLIERLLEYRAIITDENKDSRMICTVNLLEFYNEINRKEMYIRYLYKLCDIHLECDNFTEAAFTLKLHAQLLKWSDESLHPILRNKKYPHSETHRELKESLYNDMINYFDKGKMWEIGLSVCKELVEQYENETFDYIQLSELLKRMSTFYDNIMKQLRPEPEYFRVTYYGCGFPAFLQNKTFVCRGKEYERLNDFNSRLQNQFPAAQLMTKLDPPGEEIKNSKGQYLQINKVDPVMEEKKKFANKIVDDQILKFYRVNEVQKFTFSRPFRKVSSDSDNEFANLWVERTTLQTSHSLPGILRWFPVIASRSYEMSPLENAIEALETTNKKLHELISSHHADSTLPLNPLSMHLNGIVDAAVMGGIINYEKAFFTDEYLQKNPTRKDSDGVKKLKDLIAQQIPLLEMGLIIHKKYAPENLKPFHDRMEDCFLKLKTNVEEKYGKRPLTSIVNKTVSTMRRIKTLPRKSTFNQSDRLSDISLSMSDIILPSSKISPTARAQSVFVRPASPSGNKTLKQKRENTLRRSSAASMGSKGDLESQSQTLWYDTKNDEQHSQQQSQQQQSQQQQQQPLIELNEQLTPRRPLRSEADKRSSRPSSGQFRSLRPTPSPIRNTMPVIPLMSMTPPSPPSNDVPPPLPQKQAYADYNNLPRDDVHPPIPRKGSLPLSAYVRDKPLPPLPGRETTAPTPPKKLHRPVTTNH